MKLTRPLTRPMAALATLALVAAACGGGGDESADSTAPSSTSTTTTTTTKPTTTTSSTSTTTTVPEIIRQPLTGAPLASADEIIARPALVAKIDNNAAAVPNHSGLAVADIVFEEVVEGRTTRFAAAFHSQSSDPIGPIRSGRTQDVDLFTSFFFPLFVWSGGNPGVTRAINESTLINMGPNNARGYFRGPGRAPHNFYTSTDVIWEQAPGDEPTAPRQQFVYLEAEQAFDGDASSGVKARVGSENIEWTWNPELAKFDRSQRGRPHDDALWGRIRATNVIVMGVRYQPSSVDRNSPEAQTVGTGPVWVFSDGKVTTGSWTRDVNTEPLEFVTADGEPIALNPGNTWIELADNNDVDAGGVEVLPAAPPVP
jgi:hypothetical protein